MFFFEIKTIAKIPLTSKKFTILVVFFGFQQ